MLYVIHIYVICYTHVLYTLYVMLYTYVIYTHTIYVYIALIVDSYYTVATTTTLKRKAIILQLKNKFRLKKEKRAS